MQRLRVYLFIFSFFFFAILQSFVLFFLLFFHLIAAFDSFLIVIMVLWSSPVSLSLSLFLLPRIVSHYAFHVRPFFFVKRKTASHLCTSGPLKWRALSGLFPRLSLTLFPFSLHFLDAFKSLSLWSLAPFRLVLSSACYVSFDRDLSVIIQSPALFRLFDLRTFSLPLPFPPPFQPSLKIKEQNEIRATSLSKHKLSLSATSIFIHYALFTFTFIHALFTHFHGGHLHPWPITVRPFDHLTITRTAWYVYTRGLTLTSGRLQLPVSS